MPIKDSRKKKNVGLLEDDEESVGMPRKVPGVVIAPDNVEVASDVQTKDGKDKKKKKQERQARQSRAG